MKTTTLIQTLAVAAILSLSGISTTQRHSVTTKPAEAGSQKITVIYGDVPVSLDANHFEMPLNQLF